MDERDVINKWRVIFDGKPVTKDSLAKAEALLGNLSGESPLHIRLAQELAELQKLEKKR